MQNKQVKKSRILLVKGIHLNANKETTVHNNSNKYMKGAQEGKNRSRYYL